MQEIAVLIIVFLAIAYAVYALFLHRRKHQCSCRESGLDTCDRNSKSSGCEGCPLYDNCKK